MNVLSVNDIRDLVLDRLAQGIYPFGSKLPTSRELAKEIGVNRNTVTKAYRMLAEMGMVNSTQGRGTYALASGYDGYRSNIALQIRNEVTDLVQKARRFGITEDDLRSIAVGQIEEVYRKNVKQAVFIECNTGDAEAAVTEVKRLTGYQLVPLLLEDVEADPADVACNHAVIFTSLFHLREISNLFASTAPTPRIVGIYTLPDEQALAEIAQIPSNSHVGIVTSNADGGQRFVNQIAAVTQIKPQLIVRPTVEQIRQLAEEVSVIVCSRSQAARISSLQLTIPVITLSFHVSQQSTRRVVDELDGTSNVAESGEQ